MSITKKLIVQHVHDIKYVALKLNSDPTTVAAVVSLLKIPMSKVKENISLIGSALCCK